MNHSSGDEPFSEVKFYSEDTHAAAVEADGVITVQRAFSVRVFLIIAFVLGMTLLCATLLLFGGRAKWNPQFLMPCILGMFLAGLMAVAFFWIRARFVCVAVLDDNGVLARTTERKYDLKWDEIIGARTKITYPKDGGTPKVHLLLILEEQRFLEMPIRFEELQKLNAIQQSVALKQKSEGQPLGTLKASLLFVFGVIGLALGLWWVYVLSQQWNNGLLFRGNIKAVFFKIGIGIAGPIAGLSSAIFGLYHILARPILYQPGWIETKKWN